MPPPEGGLHVDRAKGALALCPRCAGSHPATLRGPPLRGRERAEGSVPTRAHRAANPPGRLPTPFSTGSGSIHLLFTVPIATWAERAFDIVVCRCYPAPIYRSRVPIDIRRRVMLTDRPVRRGRIGGGHGRSRALSRRECAFRKGVSLPRRALARHWLLSSDFRRRRVALPKPLRRPSCGGLATAAMYERPDHADDRHPYLPARLSRRVVEPSCGDITGSGDGAERERRQPGRQLRGRRRLPRRRLAESV